MIEYQNLLTAGAAGFIGPNFVRDVFQRRPIAKVVNLDLLTYAGSRSNLDGLPFSAFHVFVLATLPSTPGT